MKRSTTTTSNRSPPALAVFGLLFLLPLATMFFGGVHLFERLMLTLFLLVSGVALAIRGRFDDHRKAIYIVLAGLVLAAVPLIPVSGDWRQFFHGDLAAPVQNVHDLLGRSFRPLALDPAGALLGWSEAAAYVIYGLGLVSWCTRAGRVDRMQQVMIATGVAVVGVMGVHLLLDLESIYGSGVGVSSRDGFYAPFVNPNHAGIFCAAVLSVAITKVQIGPLSSRLIAFCSVAVLCFGVWSSGSRGAVVAALVGIATTLFCAGGRTLRMLVAGALGLVVLVVAMTDTETVVRILGTWVAPSVNQMVDAGYVDITTGRLNLWSDTLTIVGSVWPLGVGAGGFDQAYRMVRSDVGFNISSHAHNEPLQLFAEHGFAAFIIALGLLVWVFRLAWSSLDLWSERQDRRLLVAGLSGCATALLTASLVSFPFRLHSHAILLVMCLGGLVGLARPHRGGKRVGPRLRWLIGIIAALSMGGVLVVNDGDVEPFARSGSAMDSGVAWFDVSKSYEPESTLRREALAASTQHFERAVIRGLDRRAFQWLARLRVATGDVDGADAVLEAGTQIYPTMPWLWRDRARLAQRTGEAELARQSWKRMLNQDLPGSVEPTDVLREALFGGEFDVPIEQARAILPERADRYRQAARVMDELSLREEAETLFRHALALEPNGVLYYAKALVRWGRYADAVMLLEPHKRSCSAERFYAQALAQIGRHADAADAYASALGLCGPTDWSLRVGLAKARLYSGDSRGADVVESLLEARPEAHGLRRAWLWVLSKRGRTVDAVRHLEHLKWAGVMTGPEGAALERAKLGLPFSLPHLAPSR